jgi:hypothetical protein
MCLVIYCLIALYEFMAGVTLISISRPDDRDLEMRLRQILVIVRERSSVVRETDNTDIGLQDIGSLRMYRFALSTQLKRLTQESTPGNQVCG